MGNKIINLLFVNKHFTLKYITKHLKFKFSSIVLPDIIGEKLNNHIASIFPNVDYYSYTGYKPNFDEIIDKVDKSTIIYYKEICGHLSDKAIYDLSEKAGLVINDVPFCFMDFMNTSFDIHNLIIIGDIFIKCKYPSSSFAVFSKGLLDIIPYGDLQRSDSSMDFVIADFIYRRIPFISNMAKGLRSIIDENILRMKNGDKERLPENLEKQLYKMDFEICKNKLISFNSYAKKNFNNKHIYLMMKNNCVYTYLILLVRDKEKLVEYLKSLNIESIDYFSYDIPLNTISKKTNNEIVLIPFGLYYNQNDIRYIIEVLNKW
ncbi:hypothetical protein KAU43_04445 [candidate division WOR-3 bacterium]|jgi:hypothetical protein|nr:hypothetical protein [candidate division WOR-3 bacterium]